MKRADISLTTIVVAAIALIVLIVMIAIFTGKIKVFSEGYTGTTDTARGNVCSAQGGSCRPAGSCVGIPAPLAGWVDCASSEVCC